MRPFKMFFGLTIAIMLFFFVAKFFLFAFIVAGVMSIVFAIFRRIKDFVTYDRYGESYIKRYEHNPNLAYERDNVVEPLFFATSPSYRSEKEAVHFVNIS